MAKTAAKKGRAAEGGTLTGYFRKILLENPKLLKTRSNQELLDRWLADHPDQKAVPDNVKSAVSNAKGALRQKLRKRKGGRPKAEQPPAAAGNGEPQKPKATPRVLERLEERIDDCLALAKHIDREGLEAVIKLLRRARNEVVWMIGQ